MVRVASVSVRSLEEINRLQPVLAIVTDTK